MPEALAAYLSDPTDVAAAGAAAGRAVRALQGEQPRPAPMRDHLLLAEERLMRLRERGTFGVIRNPGPADWFLLAAAGVHSLAAIAQALEGGVRDAIEQVRPPSRQAQPAQGSTQPEGAS